MYEIMYIFSGVTSGVAAIFVLMTFGIYAAMLLHVRAALQDLQDTIIDIDLLFKLYLKYFQTVKYYLFYIF